MTPTKLTKGTPLASLSLEKHFTERQSISATIAATEKRLAALRNKRAECNRWLAKFMERDQLVRFRDGTCAQRRVVTVDAVTATDAWFAEHRNTVIRSSYSYSKYDLMVGD